MTYMRLSLVAIVAAGLLVGALVEGGLNACIKRSNISCENFKRAAARNVIFWLYFVCEAVH
jgi:hypothetical protein